MMPGSRSAQRILLISSSKIHRSGYLDHAREEIRRTLGQAERVLFLPYALFDRAEYTARTRSRFASMDLALESIDDAPDPRRSVAEAQAVFVGGGNTFRLLTALYRNDLLEPIRRHVAEGKPYIGSSAGSIVAGPSLGTTKDMPILQPPSFQALSLVPFHISPHYLDPDPTSTHMGETQEERILQFLEEQEGLVVGLREGGMLRVEDGETLLTGVAGARIFRKGEAPEETLPPCRLDGLLTTSGNASP